GVLQGGNRVENTPRITFPDHVPQGGNTVLHCLGNTFPSGVPRAGNAVLRVFPGRVLRGGSRGNRLVPGLGNTVPRVVLGGVLRSGNSVVPRRVPVLLPTAGYDVPPLCPGRVLPGGSRG